MNNSILFDAKDRVKAHQMAMAKNIGRLSSKAAQKRQASLLCRSLVKMIKGSR